MSSNLYYNPNYEDQHDKRNSLPTYEEAMRQQTIPSSLTSSTVINNLNEHLPLNSGTKTTYQSHSHAFSDLSSSSRHEERSVPPSATTQHHNSTACQISQTEQEQCGTANAKKSNNITMECIGLAIAVLLGILFIVIKMSHSTLNSTDSTRWTSQPHKHH